MGDDKTGDTKARVLEVGGAELVKARAELRELDLDAEGKLDELVPDLANERREKRAEVANLEKLLAAPAVSLAEWDAGRFKPGEAPAIAWLVDETFALGEAVMLAAPGDAG